MYDGRLNYHSRRVVSKVIQAAEGRVSKFTCGNYKSCLHRDAIFAFRWFTLAVENRLYHYVSRCVLRRFHAAFPTNKLEAKKELAHRETYNNLENESFWPLSSLLRLFYTWNSYFKPRIVQPRRAHAVENSMNSQIPIILRCTWNQSLFPWLGGPYFVVTELLVIEMQWLLHHD